MSRRIRRGRRGINLPLKNPPASTDRVIGHDANGTMFQATIAALTGAVFGNISVIENTSTGQWNARIPVGASGGIQIDYNPAAEVTRDNTVRLRGTAPYLRSFAHEVRPFITLPQIGAYYSGNLNV